MTQQTSPNREPTPSRMLARGLRSAVPYLAAPFPPANIGMFVRHSRRSTEAARVVFYVPKREIERRLTHPVGAGRWACGKPSALTHRSLTCSLRLLGATFVAVGRGVDEHSQFVNGFKHCAEQAGVGVYLKEIAVLELPIGNGAEQVPTGPNTDPVLTPSVAILARTHYTRELERLADRFGPALVHHQRPWNIAGERTVRLGRPRGLAGLTARMLAHTDRRESVPGTISSLLQRLVTSSPAGLSERIDARYARDAAGAEAQPTGLSRTPLSVVPTDGSTRDTVAVDFGQLGPESSRRVA
jgi:hypothetical protein